MAITILSTNMLRDFQYGFLISWFPFYSCQNLYIIPFDIAKCILHEMKDQCSSGCESKTVEGFRASKKICNSLCNILYIHANILCIYEYRILYKVYICIT